MTEAQRKLGRYELLRRVASGGMGEIYLARTRGAGGFEKLVIIKTILPHLAEEEEFVTKFLDEGRIVVQLTHGNIVPVFDMGEDDGEYYIAMEYVPGLDLRAVLKRLDALGEQLPVSLALHVACEICKGLSYAHRKTDDQGRSLGIVHRDVSPSNVLISREGEVKIIDFGIARAADKVAQTASGRIQGKCCYMSPEQARGKPLDARSDIFSAGVLLYEMLTLVRPFEGRSDLESLELVRQCEVDAPGILRPELSEELDQIVCRALAPDPDERYQTIDDLMVDLQQEIYRLGETVTSHLLTEALSEVFEADDPADSKAPRPANLDEAFELELARLGGDEPATASGSHLSPALAQTATATPKTRTLSAQTGDEELPQKTEEPDSTDGTDGHTTAPESPAAKSEEDSPDEAAIATGSVPASAPPRVLSRRHLVITAAAAITASVAIVAFFIFGPVEDATLELVSDPPGAQIHLDGDELPGLRTPDTLTLAPGEYTVELTLEDHIPRRFRIQLAAGERRRLDKEDLLLQPEHQPLRQFLISATPEDATIIADGEALGAGPHDLSLEQGDVINLSARAQGCSSADYVLSYRHRREEIHLELDCDDEGDDEALLAEADTDQESNGTAPTTIIPRHRSIRIESDPPGAEILVNEELLGQAPLYAELRVNQAAIIEARRDGYEPYRTTTRPDELDGDRLEVPLRERPRGCLTFRAVYPAHNEIAINGEWLDGLHATLQNHSLPAGDHTITVRHPPSGKEDSFPVHIKPGSDCKVLTVWERD